MADNLLSLPQDFNKLNRSEMLISIIVGLLLALIFGKITVKEIKEHVRKHTERKGNDNTGGKESES
jgi:hypothetical protein